MPKAISHAKMISTASNPITEQKNKASALQMLYFTVPRLRIV
jgi:hypothetical protein